jgi:hypothetical protein
LRTTCNPTISSCPTDKHNQYSTVSQCTTSTPPTCPLEIQTCGEAGYLCVDSTNSHACATSATGCSTDVSCDTANGYSCISNKCSKRGQGTACTADNQCTTGHCADDVCCDKACTGCSACTNSLTGGTTGQCQPVTAGKDAHNACTASGTPCGLDGNCDGAGQCHMPASGTACGTSCTGSTLTPITCNGAGACNVNGTPGPCPNSTVCGSGTVCGTLKVLGATCLAGTDCASGYCADAVCCDTACSGACMACNLSGAKGTCSAVTSGADDQCPVSCVENQYKNGQCGSAGSGGTGQCAPASPCPNGNICANGTQCAGDCSASGQCASGHF